MTISRLNRAYQSPLWAGNNAVAVTAPVFTFDPVPQGYVWTGTISICAATSLTQGTGSPNPPGSDSHNDFIANMIFTLYRNQQPEMVWIGFSQAVNVQLFSNDKVVVTGRYGGGGATNPPLTSQNPLGLVCSFIGFASGAQETTPVVPFVSGSAQVETNATMDHPSGLIAPVVLTQAGVGTNNITLPTITPYTNVRVWCSWLNLSVQNTAGNWCRAFVQDSLNNVFNQVVITGSGGVQSTVDVRGYYATPPLSLHVIDNSSTATGVICTTGVMYTPELIV